MDVDSQTVISTYLQENERVLWAERPQRGILFRSVDWFIVPFSLLGCGSFFFWSKSFFKFSSHDPFSFFQIGFVVMYLYLLFGRFLVNAWQRSRIFYAITDKRIIIVSGLIRKVRSVNLRTLSDITFSEHSGDKGTITFGGSAYQNQWMGAMPWFGMNQYIVPCFEYIDDAKSVYELIQRTQKTER